MDNPKEREQVYEHRSYINQLLQVEQFRLNKLTQLRSRVDELYEQNVQFELTRKFDDVGTYVILDVVYDVTNKPPVIEKLDESEIFELEKSMRAATDERRENVYSLALWNGNNSKQTVNLT